LRAALLQAYGHTDERPFRPHVTVARIRGNGRAIAKEHPIDQDLSLTQARRLYRALSISSSRRERLSGPCVVATWRNAARRTGHVVSRARG
jgi:hypothetical protein